MVEYNLYLFLVFKISITAGVQVVFGYIDTFYSGEVWEGAGFLLLWGNVSYPLFCLSGNVQEQEFLCLFPRYDCLKNTCLYFAFRYKCLNLDTWNTALIKLYFISFIDIAYLFKIQIESLNDKLQNAKEQLREKEFIMLQNEQEISQLKKEIERTQQRMKEMESVSKLFPPKEQVIVSVEWKESLCFKLVGFNIQKLCHNCF